MLAHTGRLSWNFGGSSAHLLLPSSPPLSLHGPCTGLDMLLYVAASGTHQESRAVPAASCWPTARTRPAQPPQNSRCGGIRYINVRRTSCTTSPRICPEVCFPAVEGNTRLPRAAPSVHPRADAAADSHTHEATRRPGNVGTQSVFRGQNIFSATTCVLLYLLSGAMYEHRRASSRVWCRTWRGVLEQ